MKLIDLSQPLYDGAPNCPVHPPIRIERIADHSPNGWRVEGLALSSHSGSHVDAPLHRFKDGLSTEEFPLESFIGLAFIADFRGAAADTPITSAALAERLKDELADRIILLATGWGERRAKTSDWLDHSPFLTPDGAQWLVGQGVRAVGIDHYSIGGGRDPGNTNTHEILLGSGLWIVEELRCPPELFALRQPFEFWSLPINLLDHSGSFCRPVALVSR